jgi:hypothetical protein
MAACSTIAFGQQDDHRQTLPEIARKFAPEPVHQLEIRETVFLSLEGVLPITELVVHSTVARVTTYLSADEKDLYTDYLIAPIRVILQRGAPALTSDIARTPIVVNRWGGETTIDDVRVIQEDYELRPFRVGEKLVLLLRKDEVDGKYRLVSIANGAFSLGDSRMEPVVRGGDVSPVFDSVRGLTVAQFEAEVHRLNR